MKQLIIEETKSTPYICFNPESGYLKLQGESYPENVAKFYTPIIEWIEQYLRIESSELLLEFNIKYFNSSTSKIFMMILERLDEAVISGKKATVKWLCDKDNDISIECGEEFQEDLKKLPFEIETY